MWHCNIDESAVNNMMDTGFSTPAYQFNANKIKETTEPIQEAIYDFGGANVKSCASIALNKSISKGLIPAGTKLPQQWATTSTTITSPSTIPSKILLDISTKTAKIPFQMHGQFI